MHTPAAVPSQGVRVRWLGWLSLAGLFCGVAARAQTIDFNSTTLVRLHPDWRAGDARTGVGAIEWLGLSARGIPTPFSDDLSVQVSGWGSADMLPRSPDRI